LNHESQQVPNKKKAMKTVFQVLSEDERARIHEASLDILKNTGVRVETDQGRRLLKKAGAMVDETFKIVRFPRHLVEESLKLVPKDFILGARRPGADLNLNVGDCTLCLDGCGTMVLDRQTGERRPATYADWHNITRMADAVDEIGIYWAQVEPVDKGNTLADQVDYMCRVQRNFSKHVQDTIDSPAQAVWLKEVLQTVFGSRDEIRQNHPMSFLLCPQSPLIIDRDYIEAYLALKGLNIPAAVMPMPQMGATAPASMISTVVQGNCEVLAMLYWGAGLLLLSALAPAPIAPPITEVSSLAGEVRAPWFFLWIQGLLRFGNPFWFGVVIPLLVLGFVSIVPYLFPAPSEEELGSWFPPSGRPAQLAGLIVVLLIIGLSILAW